MKQRQITVANGDATIVAEVLESSNDDAVVVMVPSYARGAEDFTEKFGSDLAVRVAEAGYTVVLPWPRGFGDGLSTGDMTAMTMDRLGGDVAAVIEAESPAPVALLGHAYGQRVARMVATNHPELVDRLVLAAAGGIAPTPPEATGAIRILAHSEASRDEKLAALELAFFAPGNDASIWIEGWDGLLGLAQISANDPAIVDHWWSGGGVVPMYVLQADRDFTAPAADSSAILAAQFPDRVEITTITGAGHAMLPEQPEQVAEAVLDFLSR